MLAGYHGVVSSDDDYNKIREKYGDTTEPQSHLDALKSLGLKGSYLQDGDKGLLTTLIDLGKPVAVGWLHKGHILAPSGFGHWSVVVGYTDHHTVHHDPNGEVRLVTGGYTQNTNGEKLYYSWKNWLPRWEVNGNDGYMLYVN